MTHDPSDPDAHAAPADEPALERPRKLKLGISGARRAARGTLPGVTAPEAPSHGLRLRVGGARLGDLARPTPGRDDAALVEAADSLPVAEPEQVGATSASDLEVADPVRLRVGAARPLLRARHTPTVPRPVPLAASGYDWDRDDGEDR